MNEKIEMITQGAVIDRKSDPEGKRIYLIETYTFRLLDSDLLRDFLLSEPRPLDAWETYCDNQPAFLAEEQRRYHRRQVWDATVLSMLTSEDYQPGECKGWNFSNLISEVFSAARIIGINTEAGA